jgi:hypothetical protein
MSYSQNLPLKFLRKLLFIDRNTKHLHFLIFISARNLWIVHCVICGKIYSQNSVPVYFKWHDLDGFDLDIVFGWLYDHEWIHTNFTTWKWTFSTE